MAEKLGKEMGDPALGSFRLIGIIIPIAFS